MMASSQPPARPVKNDVTVRERGLLFGWLEPQSKLVRAAVAQVLVGEQGRSERPGWTCLGCGLVCLVEDQSIHSHFLRLYCVKRAKLLWEQELYIPFKYAATCTFFHTFPADGHQVGLNFANEAEANRFHLAVKTIQRKQEKTVRMDEIINAEDANKSSDPPDSGIKPVDKRPPLTTVAPAVTSATSSVSEMLKHSILCCINDLDAAMMRQMMQSRLIEKDLKDRDFPRLKAVQRELMNRGPVTQTRPKALKKRPLPPLPSITSSSTFSPQSQIEPHNPPSAPVLPERIRDSASAKPVDPLSTAERGEVIVTTLREIFRQKQLLQ